MILLVSFFPSVIHLAHFELYIVCMIDKPLTGVDTTITDAMIDEIVVECSEYWTQDKVLAKQMLSGEAELDKDWLCGVIDGCTDEECIELRSGFSNDYPLPKNLFFNYEGQYWIESKDADGNATLLNSKAI